MKWGLFFLLLFQSTNLFCTSWVSGNYETEFARYYLGISEPNGTRIVALNSALSLALEKAGIENASIHLQSVRNTHSSSQSTQLIKNSKKSFFGESNSVSTGNIGRKFSSKISNVVLMDEYWDGEVGFALIRIPKPGFESFNFLDWNERENFKRRWGSAARSVVIPGWGSFHQQKPLRGTLFILGTLASAGIIYNSQIEYNKSIDLMNNSIIGVDKQRFYDQSNKHLVTYNIGLISLSTLYIWNVLDPIVFPGKYRDYYYVKSRRLKRSSIVSSNKRMLTYSKWHDPGLDIDLHKLDLNPLEFIFQKTQFTSIGVWEYFSPQIYGINYNFNQDVLQGFEFGVSFQQLLVKSNFKGLNPYVTFDLGWMNFFQNWDGDEEFASQYDLGRGLSSSTVNAYDFNYRIEVGVNRWIGMFNLFTGLSYRPEKTVDSWYVNAYNGETDDEGDKLTDHVWVDSEQLPYPEITFGGTTFVLGISLGF